MYHKKKKSLGMKGMRMAKEMQRGGKVKGLLKGLEAMPTKDAGAAKKKFPKTVSEIPGYDFKATSALFRRNLNKILSEANKAMEQATGLKKGAKGMKMPGGGKMPMKMPGGGKMHMKMPGGGKMPMYMAGGKVYKDGGSLMAALLKDPKQRARAKKIMGM